MSKAGQRDIRRLLIIGAMTRLNWLGRKSIGEGSWLDRLARRNPRMLVAVALANKMARTIWAMVTRQESYRDPVRALSACSGTQIIGPQHDECIKAKETGLLPFVADASMLPARLYNSSACNRQWQTGFVHGQAPGDDSGSCSTHANTC